MNLNEISQILNFKQTKNGYYKIINGYLFSLNNDSFPTLLIQVNGCFEEEKMSFIYKYINKKNVRFLTSFNSSIKICKAICFYLDSNASQKKIEDYAMLIKDLVNYIQESELRPNNTCRFCHQETTEVISLNHYSEFGHRDCLDKYKEYIINAIDSTQMNEKPFNVFVSMLFSLLGALVVLIPMILLYIYTNSYSFMFSLLLPIVSFKFYRFGKAVVDKKATICAICFSFICFIIMCFVIVYKNLNVYTYSSVMLSVKNNLYNLLIAFVAYGLGILFSIRIITNTIVKQRKEIEKL